MARSRPLSTPWRSVGIVVYFGLNLGLLLALTPGGADWDIVWRHIPAALASDDLYGMETELGYIWSPVAAPILALVVQAGYWPYFVLHVAAVLLLRDERLIALMLLS